MIYNYEVTWKGDTVVRMVPLGDAAETGYSDFEQKRVRVYYGKDGPAPLYQREHLLEECAMTAAPLRVDRSSLDFW